MSFLKVDTKPTGFLFERKKCDVGKINTQIKIKLKTKKIEVKKFKHSCILGRSHRATGITKDFVN